MTKRVIISYDLLKKMCQLMKNKNDNSYTIIKQFGENNEYSYIAQYSKKYDNIQIVNVKTQNLIDKGYLDIDSMNDLDFY